MNRFRAVLVVVGLVGCISCDAPPPAPAAGPNAIAITITTTPAGATVLVDGVVVGPSPVTVPLNPGPHRIKAAQSGYYPLAEQRIQVSAGEPTSHALALVASH